MKRKKGRVEFLLPEQDCHHEALVISYYVITILRPEDTHPSSMLEINVLYKLVSFN